MVIVCHTSRLCLHFQRSFALGINACSLIISKTSTHCAMRRTTRKKQTSPVQRLYSFHCTSCLGDTFSSPTTTQVTNTTRLNQEPILHSTATIPFLIRFPWNQSTEFTQLRKTIQTTSLRYTTLQLFLPQQTTKSNYTKPIANPHHSVPRYLASPTALPIHTLRRLLTPPKVHLQ